jgi:hypothetical protein
MAVKYNFIKTGLSWYWIFPFMIPIALDGGIQTIATMVGFGEDTQFYLSTNFMRMITGSLFGIGLGAIIAPFIKSESEPLRVSPKVNKVTDKKTAFSTPFRLTAIFMALLSVYLLLIQLWRLTTPEYQPEGITDHIVREAPPVNDWVDSRRLHSK